MPQGNFPVHCVEYEHKKSSSDSHVVVAVAASVVVYVVSDRYAEELTQHSRTSTKDVLKISLRKLVI